MTEGGEKSRQKDRGAGKNEIERIKSKNGENKESFGSSFTGSRSRNWKINFFFWFF